MYDNLVRSRAGVRRVWHQFREEGHDHPVYANCGPKPLLDESGMQKLADVARARRDAFCLELADNLDAAIGVRLSRQCVGRWLATLGQTR